MYQLIVVLEDHFCSRAKMMALFNWAHACSKFETALDNDKVMAGHALTKIQALYSTGIYLEFVEKA